MPATPNKFELTLEKFIFSSRWLLVLGVGGFIGAGLCGVWILFSIWRSGKHT